MLIGNTIIDQSSPTFVVAEIGLNHNGSLDLAMELVEHAAAAGANCAKFQMRNMAALYRNGGDPNGQSTGAVRQSDEPSAKPVDQPAISAAASLNVAAASPRFAPSAT